MEGKMGLTVHYELKFRGTPEQAKEKLNQIRKVAMDMPFEEVSPLWELDYRKDFNNEEENARVEPSDRVESYRWAKIQYEPKGKWTKKAYIPNMATKEYKGWVTMIWAGDGCEPTNIGLVSKDGWNWEGHSFTKTQYAENFVKAHLLVITILDVCQKLGILKDVHDEGDYWKTRDIKVLGGKINEYTSLISGLTETMKKMAEGTDWKIDSAIDKSKNIVIVKGAKNGDSIRQKSRISG